MPWVHGSAKTWDKMPQRWIGPSWSNHDIVKGLHSLVTEREMASVRSFETDINVAQVRRWTPHSHLGLYQRFAMVDWHPARPGVHSYWPHLNHSAHLAGQWYNRLGHVSGVISWVGRQTYPMIFTYYGEEEKRGKRNNSVWDFVFTPSRILACHVPRPPKEPVRLH